MRARAIPILLAAVFPACTFNTGQPPAIVRAHYDGDGWTTLMVHTDVAGVITLRGAADTAVYANAILPSLVDVDPETVRSQVELGFERSGDTLELVAIGGEWLTSEDGSASIDVWLPAGRALEVSGAILDVTAEGMTGAVHVAVSMGDLSIDTSGDVDLATGKGDIRGAAGGGTIRALAGGIQLLWPGARSLSIEEDEGAIDVMVPADVGFSARLVSGQGEVEVEAGGIRAIAPTWEGAVGAGGSALLDAYVSLGRITVHSSFWPEKKH